jgi:acyl-CoA thioesterase FadM
MLLFFRCVWTLWWSGFRSKIGPLDSSVVRFRALPHDCDLNRHLNAGRFISFTDIARVELLGRMRVLKPALKRGWRPIVGGMTIRYRRSILPFERFAIRTRLVAWDEKWFYLEHVVETAKGELAAHVIARTLLRHKGGNVHPSELVDLVGAGPIESPAMPEFVEQWRRAEDAR